MPSHSYTKGYLLAILYKIENLSTDPAAETGRVYYNTVDKRPKICVEDA